MEGAFMVFNSSAGPELKIVADCFGCHLMTETTPICYCSYEQIYLPELFTV